MFCGLREGAATAFGRRPRATCVRKGWQSAWRSAPRVQEVQGQVERLAADVAVGRRQRAQHVQQHVAHHVTVLLLELNQPVLAAAKGQAGRHAARPETPFGALVRAVGRRYRRSTFCAHSPAQ